MTQSSEDLTQVSVATGCAAATASSTEQIQSAAAAAAPRPPPEATSKVISSTPVNEMFNGRSVFITGASGFIGRVLLEKLLRCYPGIKRIYILMRAKKNQQPYERLHKQLLKVPIFDKIREMEAESGTEILNKIVVVAGDIAEPKLGISSEDMKMMLEDKSLAIVFHSAATIKFDEPLKVSVKLNLIATKTIIEICRQLPNLISLCHVSTAYVNSDIRDNSPIEERIYPMRDEPQSLIKLAEIMDEDLMQTLKLQLVAARPNTYTYTKALAEHLIAREASDLPVAIVRPSIVVAAWKDPIPGWIDNLNGPTGLILAIGKGLLRSMHTHRGVKADVIPVDIVINTMIASAFYAAKTNGKLEARQDSGAMSISQLPATVKSIEGAEVKRDSNRSQHQNSTRQASVEAKHKQQPVGNAHAIANNNNNNNIEKHANNNNCKSPMTRGEDLKQVVGGGQNEQKTSDDQQNPPIFQCNSGQLRPITWGQMEDMFFPTIRRYPSCQVLRYPYGSFKSNKYHDLVTRLFVHYLPALIIDMICMLMGKKRQLLSVYFKLHSAVAALTHFCTQNYNFQSENFKMLRESLSESDRKELYMNTEELDWAEFWDSYVLGARRYVLKEEDHTLPEARKSFLRAYYIEMGLRALLFVLLAACCMPLVMRLPGFHSLGTLQV